MDNKRLSNRFLGIKRWITMITVGLFMLSLGVLLLIQNYFNTVDVAFYQKVLLIGFGVILIIIGTKNGLSVILKVTSKYKNFEKYDSSTIDEMLYLDRVQSRGPKIVAVGGGTGLSTLLRELKNHTGNITAIVTVADDGGGSGVLREDMGILPPGDIRNCIMALANAEPSMDRLLNYRFRGGMLKGQSFGNLFIAAMNDMYGDFNVGIKEMSNVLAVKGNVLPMTVENVKLVAKLENGAVIEGESQIPVRAIEQDSRIESVFTIPEEIRAMPGTVRAIKEADCIVIGPGSLYTSIMPNLLVKEIVEAIENSNAKKIYISNIMTQPGETIGYSVLDHLEAIEKHSNSTNLIDFIIVNNEKLNRRSIRKYLKDDADLIAIDDDEIRVIEDTKKIRVYKGNLINIIDGTIRHSPKLAEMIMDIYLNHSQKIYKREKS